jgi:cysteine desulfurase family protein
MKELIYFDNAATTFPKPEEVYRFMDNFYRNHGVNPGRSGFDAALETEEIVFETRKLLTELFNGDDPNRLTFSYNASDSLNMIIQGLAEKDDHVITTNLEHNSVLRPLHHLEQQNIISVTYIPFDQHGFVDPDNFRNSITPKTKMVVLNHASNILGTVQNAKEIGKICKEKGVYFILDASQSAGNGDIDVEAWGVDAVVFTGHKSLLGPTGIGGSFVSKDLPVKGTRFGGTGVRSAQRTHLSEFPYRLECGTLNILGVAGLNAGIKWVRQQDIKKLADQKFKLYNYFRKSLQEIENVVVYCGDNPENQLAVLCMNILGLPAGDVGMMLDVDHNIAVRTGLQCAPLVHQQLGTDKIKGTVRFSLGPFNTEEHINKAIAGVKDIASLVG